MVLVSSIPGTSSQSQSSSVPLRTSKHVKEDAQKYVVRHFKGASPMSLVKVITTLFDQGSLRETDNDVQGALFKYYQAASVLSLILQHHEYQQETGKGNHGALYKLVETTMQHFTDRIKPRILELERRHGESVQSALSTEDPGSPPQESPPSPSDDGPVQRSGGSLQDRMRALAGAGMNMATVAGTRTSLNGLPSTSRVSHHPTASLPTISLSAGTESTHERPGSIAYPQRPPVVDGLLPSHTTSTPVTSETSSPPVSMNILTPTATTPALPTWLNGQDPPSPKPGPEVNRTQPAPEPDSHSLRRVNGSMDLSSFSPKSLSSTTSPPPPVPPFPSLSQPPSPQPSQQNFSLSQSISYPSSSSYSPSHPLTPVVPSHSTGGSSHGGRSSHRNSVNGAVASHPTGNSLGVPITPSVSHFNSMFPSIDEFDPTYQQSSNTLSGQMERSLASLEAIENLTIDPSTSSMSALNALPAAEALPQLPVFPSVPRGKVGEKVSTNGLPPAPTAPPPKELWRDLPVPPVIPDMFDLSEYKDSTRQDHLPNGANHYRPPVPKPSSHAPPPPSGPPIPRATTIIPKDLAALLVSTHKLLFLDVRDREAFEKERINVHAIVCIEPILLKRKAMDSKLLEEALIVHEEEARLFKDRHKFDLVVIYDQGSEPAHAPKSSLGSKPSFSPGASTATTDLKNMIYQNEFVKPLARLPVTLVGGMDAWVKEMGRDSRWVAHERGTPGVVAPQPRKPPLDNRNALTNGLQPMAYTTTKGDMSNGYDLSNNSREQRAGDDENTPPGTRTEPIHTLKRKSALIRPSSSGNISVYNRPLPEGPANLYAAHNPITYPSTAISPPLPSTTSLPPSSTFAPPYHGMFGHIASPPSALSSSAPRLPQPSVSNTSSPSSRRRSDYLEQAQYPYSGSIMNGATRSPIDYPTLSAQNLVQPPPPVLSTTMERTDNRPRHGHGQSQSYKQGALNAPGFPSSAPIIIDGKTIIPPPTIKSYYPVTYWSHEKVGLSGLKNLGNTCYTNAIVQCLSATVPFTRFFIDGRWKSAVNLHNPLGSRGSVAQAFATLVHDMWQAEVPVQSPYEFRRQSCVFAPQFKGADQHDSQEFLSFLLDGLHEDLNRVLKKPSLDPPSPQREEELEHLPQQIASAQEWRIYQIREDSLVVDYFQGQFRNRLRCLTCGKTSTTYNSFMYLSLPIPSGRGVSKASLEQCLQSFVREEVLEKAEAWNCPQCKTLRKATKQLSLSRLPPVLLIHLKRFSVKGPFTDKLETHVTFPIRGLDLTNYMPPPLPPGEDRMKLSYGVSPDDPRTQVPPYRYDLYAVTNHYGTLSGGHYTAFIGTKGSWVYCDDSRLRDADEREIVGPAAYILFYKRVQP